MLLRIQKQGLDVTPKILIVYLLTIYLVEQKFSIQVSVYVYVSMLGFYR